MVFAIHCIDRPGALALRQATRAAHLAYLESRQSQLLLAGAILDDGAPIGSHLVVEAEDLAAAQAFAAQDPYALADLFASVSVHPFRAVFKDGQRL